MPSPTDDPETLLARATRGEDAAMARLLEEYLPRVRAFVRLRMDPALRAREETTDLVQSVCVDLLYRQDGFEYRDEPQFRSWLFTAALNKVREKQRFHGRERRDVRREVAPADELSRAYGTVATPSRNAMAREHVERLEHAFDQLPDHYREVLTLSRLVGLTHEEIAQRLGKTNGAVRQILGRALVRLAELLGEG